MAVTSPPHTHRHLLAGSGLLLVGAAIQAATGAVFWLVAARVADADAVGDAAALFTSILFVAYLGGLGLQVSLARYAPDRTNEAAVVFTRGTAATAATTALVAGGYLAVADTSATTALRAWHPVAGPGLFVVAAAGAALTVVIDVRWMTVRRWGLVVARIAAVGLLRFPLLAVPGEPRSVALFAAAALPLVVTGVWGLASMGSTATPLRWRPRPANTGPWVRFSIVNYASTLAAQAPQFALPVIVLVNVDAETNAAFYVAWGITAITLYLPFAIGQALLAEGDKDGARLNAQVRMALAGSVAAMVVIWIAAVLWSDVVTIVYGDAYQRSADLLPALVAGGVAFAVSTVLLTEARVRHRSTGTLAITVTSSVGVVVPALLLVPGRGIDGAVQAFVVGNIASAIVAVWWRWRDRSGHDVEAGPPGPLDWSLHP